MTKENERTNLDHKIDDDFYIDFLDQLKIQSGVEAAKPTEQGAHPDLLLRSCLKGLFLAVQGKKSLDLVSLIQGLPAKRKHIDSTHLADLIARAVQYHFRKSDDSSYLEYTETDWQHYFEELPDQSLSELEEILITKEVATHVLTRYRGLAALSYLYYQLSEEPVSIADIGCSLNFGLRASVKGYTLQQDLDSLIDLTENETISKFIKARKPKFKYALGIDIQAPDFEWVSSCAYFSKYDSNRKMLLKYQNLLNKDQTNGFPIHSLVSDIADERSVSKIQKKYNNGFDIIYGSMVLYQLSSATHQAALKNIYQILQPNGVFAELTFKNPKNWFLPWNAVTTVRFKDQTKLSEPYQWLEWDSSRCLVVQEGRDFEEVNRLLRSNLSN